MRRADRLFRIVQSLRRRKVTTARRLSEELEVSERTIYRDVCDLMTSGVPITGEAGVGYALQRGFDLPPLMFDEEQIEALLLGVQVVESWGDGALAEAARRVLDKVHTVLPERLQPRIGAATLFAPGFHVPEAAARRLTPLRTAIRQRRKLRIVYQGRGEARTEHTVCPLGLFFWSRTWSVATWCELRHDFRSFHVDRIDRLDPAGTFADEPGRTLEDFFRALRPHATP
jgi:predicted DNA-binding transcriptional regulator YafY